MPRMTKQQLEEENEFLRQKLEAAHDAIEDALGYEDEDDDEEEYDEDEN